MRRIIEILNFGTAFEFLIPDVGEGSNTLTFCVPDTGNASVVISCTGGEKIQTKQIGKWYPKTLAAIQAIPATEDYVELSS